MIQVLNGILIYCRWLCWKSHRQVQKISQELCSLPHSDLEDIIWHWNQVTCRLKHSKCWLAYLQHNSYCTYRHDAPHWKWSSCWTLSQCLLPALGPRSCSHPQKRSERTTLLFHEAHRSVETDGTIWRKEMRKKSKTWSWSMELKMKQRVSHSCHKSELMNLKSIEICIKRF